MPFSPRSATSRCASYLRFFTVNSARVPFYFLDTGKVDCDYYNFLKGDRSAINSYRGEYMTQYSWAEVTRSALRQQASAQKTASIPSYYAPTEF